MCMTVARPSVPPLHLFVKCQSMINHDSEHLRLLGHWHIRSRDTDDTAEDTACSRFDDLMISANDLSELS